MHHQVTLHERGAEKRRYEEFVLGADIGGTNTIVGVAGVRNGAPDLLFSVEFKTRELGSPLEALGFTLDYARDNYAIDVRRGCIACAGPVCSGGDHCRLTNAPLMISKSEILKKTPLSSLSIINDLEAVGYGICLRERDGPGKGMVAIKKGAARTPKGAAKAVVGAGSGLGKGLLAYDHGTGRYFPMPSEGGHGDFPVHTKEELELLRHVRLRKKSRGPVSYEDLLSGPGIASIYSFVRKRYSPTAYTKEIDRSKDRAALVTKYRSRDRTCRESMRLYAKFYGRCAKNFALDTKACGGIYISGGIAARHPEIFREKAFAEEFLDVAGKSPVLEDVPVYLVADRLVGLQGACFAAIRGGMR